MNDPIHDLAIFRDITDDELHWLIDHSQERSLAVGDYFGKPNDVAREFYVVLEGELQIIRSLNGQDVVMGTTPRGVIGGELWLLTGAQETVSVRAIAPSRLMVFDHPHFLQIFSHVPSFATLILRTAAERMKGIARLMNQQDKLAALGKLSAGLAHELNNPASAAQRAASVLQKTLFSFTKRTMRLCECELESEHLDTLVQFHQQAALKACQAEPLSTLEQADREDELWEWLEDRAVENPSEMAATFVTAQLTVDELEELLQAMPHRAVSNVLNWLHEGLTAVSLLDEIEQSSHRISELVAAVKSYTYMDQGGSQPVDIHRDLENTLLMLKHKLKEIEVIRQFDPTLRKVQARGGELNQVWTNLLVNAIDALGGKGKIEVITRCENNFVMVEIADNGPGIPPNVLPHIFEPFFTTKGVGAGSGMGLDISYRIVEQHNGTIEVQSQPGRTRFIVRLPAKTQG